MSYKRPVLINFARCEVRYATHFGRNADMGGGREVPEADSCNAANNAVIQLVGASERVPAV
jgi:hypothetical protein